MMQSAGNTTILIRQVTACANKSTEGLNTIIERIDLLGLCIQNDLELICQMTVIEYCRSAARQ